MDMYMLDARVAVISTLVVQVMSGHGRDRDGRPPRPMVPHQHRRPSVSRMLPASPVVTGWPATK